MVEALRLERRRVATLEAALGASLCLRREERLMGYSCPFFIFAMASLTWTVVGW